MDIQDTTRLLQGMGRTYPDPVRTDELSRHLGFEGVRAVRAVRGLFEGGLITPRGLACVEGMPGSELVLTESGMAVALGLADVEDDTRGAIAALEAQALRQLHRYRESRVAARWVCPVDASVLIRPPTDRRTSG